MFIPAQKNLTKYFRYDGSLTTPDCAEAVVWTLFTSTVQLSKGQVILWQYFIIFSKDKIICKTSPALFSHIITLQSKFSSVCCVVSSMLQLAAFNELQFTDGKPMAKTYRPVQPLNGRQIYYSAGYAAVVSAVLLISSVLVSTVGALSWNTAGLMPKSSSDGQKDHFHFLWWNAYI